MWLRLTLLSGVLLAGCTVERADDDGANASATADAAYQASAPDRAERSQGGKAVALSTDEFEFGYSYPSEAAAIPALKARLDAEREKALGEIRRDSAAAQAEAKASGYDLPGYGYEKTWQRVADLPDWLSLSATIYSFTGGAHGNYWYEAMLWDKRSGEAIDPVAAFASKAAIDGAIKTRFCKALDGQRLEKRGEVLGEESGFTACLDPSAYPILLGSSTGKTFDRITVMVPPYEAGPYAEGTYEVDLPVTPALIAALKPRFRPSFSAK